MSPEIGRTSPKFVEPGRQQGEQDRLGRVGDRREVVAREDGQGLDLGQALGGLLGIGERAAEGGPAQPCEGQVEAAGRVARGRPGHDDTRRAGPEVSRPRPVDAHASVRRPSAGSWGGHPSVSRRRRSGRRRRRCDRSGRRRPAAWACARAVGATISGQRSPTRRDARGGAARDERDRDVDLGQVGVDQVGRPARDGDGIGEVHASTVGRGPRGNGQRRRPPALNDRSTFPVGRRLLDRFADPIPDAGFRRDEPLRPRPTGRPTPACGEAG